MACSELTIHEISDAMLDVILKHQFAGFRAGKHAWEARCTCGELSPQSGFNWRADSAHARHLAIKIAEKFKELG